MKKFIFVVCMALGVCAFIGCNNGTAKPEMIENDSVTVAQNDSILEVIDSIEAVGDSLICNE